jgi:hypothetical protein
LNNAVHGGEPEAGPLAHLLGGEEGLEDAAKNKAALARDLSAFVATRPWCRGVTVAIASGAGVEARPDPSPCGRWAKTAAALPSGGLLLDRAEPPGDGAPLLCMGLSLGRDADARRWALVAEIEPRGLFAD